MSGIPQFLSSVSEPGRIKLLGMLELNLASDQLQDYRAYPRQLKFHNAGAMFRNRMLSAGNQQGKTYSAGAETAMHLTGEYPPWWNGLRFDAPIVCWAASKALPLDEPVLTPRGFVPMSCLDIGDHVIGSDGRPAEISDVYRHGARQVWRVNLTDGSQIRCDSDHLFTLRTVNRRSGQTGKWRTIPLGQLMQEGFENNHYELPERPIVHYAESSEMLVDPYLYGLLLGDGRINKKTGRLQITSMDESIIEHCRTQAEKLGLTLKNEESNSGKATTWRFVNPTPKKWKPNRLLRALAELGASCKSPSKHIHSSYMKASVSDRKALLRGLMDTDGTIGLDKAGFAIFVSTSRKLAQDVRDLAYSLGFSARLSHRCQFVKMIGREHESWGVSLWTKPSICPFRLERKKQRWHNGQKGKVNPRKLCIEGAALDGESEMQCIRINRHDGLFLAGDFVVTHNTGEATRDNVQRALLGKPKQLGTGMIPKRCLVPSLSGMARGVTGLYDFMYVKHVSGGMSMLKFRYYTQDREAWQGPPVQLVWYDEEPPVDIYEEGLARTIATQGSTMLSFTPLLGYTQVVNQYMKDPDPEHSGRHWTRMTINDAQHLTEDEKKREIARWPIHQRTARIEGLPAMGVGQIFAYEAEEITVEPFQMPKHFPILCALDVAGSSKNPRAHPTAAVKIAWDRENDCVYMLREYRKKALKPPEHWMALKRWGPKLRWAWPKDALAEEKGTGSQIMSMYRSEGMKALPIHAQYVKSPVARKKNDVNSNTSVVSVERGIMDMESRFENEQLKIFSNCPMILEEIRQYHRGDDGKVVKEMDDLLDALRYALMMLRFAKLAESSSANPFEGETIDPHLGF